MRDRFTTIHNPMLLKGYIIGSNLCTKLGFFFFFSLKVLCEYISAFKMETDRGFMVIIIVIRVFPSLFYQC